MLPTISTGLASTAAFYTPASVDICRG